MKAADDGSPGTTTSSSSSSSTCDTVIRRPSRSNATRGAAQQALGVVAAHRCSTTVVEPAAIIPAISTHDFTCALATGSSYSIPVSVGAARP